MRLAYRIALRFLWTSKGQTLMIALGIAIGISVQIFIGSLIEGLQIDLLDTTIGRSSHVTVLSEEKNQPIANYETIVASLEANFDSVRHVSPSITRGAFIKRSETTASVVVRGFDLDAAKGLYRFEESLLEGGTLPKPGTNEVLIGVKLAEDYAIAIGDTLELSIGTPDSHKAVVTGLLDLKVTALNESWMIGNLGFAQSLFDLAEDEVISVEMQVDEPFTADAVALAVAEKLEGTPELEASALKVDNWKAQNEQLLGGLTGQSSSSLLIQVFVVISVVLGIASVLAITVLQKSRQLGILKAMGINDGTASLVFLFQGFFLGVMGGVFGIAIGLGLLFSFERFALNPDGTPVVPIFINYGFMLLSGGIAISASTLAAIVPAIKSSRLSPIEVIKNG